MTYRLITTMTKPSTSVEWFTKMLPAMQTKYIDTGLISISSAISNNGLLVTATTDFISKDVFVEWFFDSTLSDVRSEMQEYCNQRGILTQNIERIIL